MHSRNRRRLVAVGITGTTLATTAFSGVAVASSDGSRTVRVSVGKKSVQADAVSYLDSTTPDGRFVVIRSNATNLVPADANGSDELYLKDTKTRAIRKIAVAFDGGEANQATETAAVSANGRYVAFGSLASNLVAEDTNGTYDVFVRDMKTGVTSRVSVGLDGTSSSGGGSSPSISDNGRLVAFVSTRADLVPNDTNNNQDVFVSDLKTHVTKRVSVSSEGVQTDPPPPPPSPPYDSRRYSTDAVISGDGTAVAFTSYATNLVPNDTNHASDVFLHTLKTGKTERVSLNDGGVQAGANYKGDGSSNPSLSRNGQVVAFTSVGKLGDGPALNHPWDSYVYNRKTQRVTKIAVTLDGSGTKYAAWEPSISENGRYVSFASYDDNIVAGDTNGKSDVFVRNLKTGRYRLASVDSAGRQGNGSSWASYIANNGKLVVFSSDATNLVPNDTNGVRDVFVRRF